MRKVSIAECDIREATEAHAKRRIGGIRLALDMVTVVEEVVGIDAVDACSEEQPREVEQLRIEVFQACEPLARRIARDRRILRDCQIQRLSPPKQVAIADVRG